MTNLITHICGVVVNVMRRRALIHTNAVVEILDRLTSLTTSNVCAVACLTFRVARKTQTSLRVWIVRERALRETSLGGVHLALHDDCPEGEVGGPRRARRITFSEQQELRLVRTY